MAQILVQSNNGFIGLIMLETLYKQGAFTHSTKQQDDWEKDHLLYQRNNYLSAFNNLTHCSIRGYLFLNREIIEQLSGSRV